MIRSTILLTMLLTGPICAAELYEDKKVCNIEIVLDSNDPTAVIDANTLLARLKTKKGDDFSQLIFDNDLKTLSEQYERVEPIISLQNGQIVISIHVFPRPTIHEIRIEGNDHISQGTILSELNVQPQTIFNRQEFNQAFNKIQQYYHKKGYFESQIDYKLIPIDRTNEVDVVIQITEGRSGIIKTIDFQGFTDAEKSDLSGQVYLKKYNFLTSWLTGEGLYRDEALEQDRAAILNYLQNKGYADARVDVALNEDAQSGRLTIEITAHRGAQYHIGEVTLVGNTLFSNEELMKRAIITSGDAYSPDKIRQSAEAMKDLYGQKGYIDAVVQSEASLKGDEPVFNIDYMIDEGQQYKIGLIHIFGNSTTESHVILRESLLVPGETFDSRKLKATQQRLEAVGYFKSVNVYAVRTPDDAAFGENYRDVYIEVEETTTGNVNLFLGFSSTDDIFGGLEITERNFHIGHIAKAIKGNMSALRGGGEYFHIRGTAGKKQNNILVSWLNPYVNDTLWRLGVELSQTYSTLQEGEKVITYGGSVTASYPLSTFWTTGMRQRLRHSNDHISLDVPKDFVPSKQSRTSVEEALNQKGLISAFSGNLNYDSLDNSHKPRRGWRSYFESEVAGAGGNYQFAKFQYINSIYFPLWSKGTLKFRGDLKFLVRFGKTQEEDIPYSERLFLGGDREMRGYKPFFVGPLVTLTNDAGQKSTINTPYGGLSSAFFSLEYNQEIFRMLDAFLFIDTGTVSKNQFDLHRFSATAGGGLRLDIGNRTPIMVGWGYIFKEKDREHRKQPFFFSMGGTF